MGWTGGWGGGGGKGTGWIACCSWRRGKGQGMVMEMDYGRGAVGASRLGRFRNTRHWSANVIKRLLPPASTNHRR